MDRLTQGTRALDQRQKNMESAQHLQVENQNVVLEQNQSQTRVMEKFLCPGPSLLGFHGSSTEPRKCSAILIEGNAGLPLVDVEPLSR
jgi:hypothetical protein